MRYLVLISDPFYCLYLAYFNANVFIWFQLVAAISVSTGCLSYGICMAYTSSAIPSMLSPNVTSPLAIESSSDMNEMLAYSSWMSKLPRKFRTFSEYRKNHLYAVMMHQH